VLALPLPRTTTPLDSSEHFLLASGNVACLMVLNESEAG